MLPFFSNRRPKKCAGVWKQMVHLVKHVFPFFCSFVDLSWSDPWQYRLVTESRKRDLLGVMMMMMMMMMMVLLMMMMIIIVIIVIIVVIVIVVHCRYPHPHPLPLTSASWLLFKRIACVCNISRFYESVGREDGPATQNPPTHGTVGDIPAFFDHRCSMTYCGNPAPPKGWVKTLWWDKLLPVTPGHVPASLCLAACLTHQAVHLSPLSGISLGYDESQCPVWRFP